MSSPLSPTPPSPPPEPVADPKALARLRQSAALLTAKVRRAREDFEAFFEFAWHDADGKPVRIEPYQREWLKVWSDYPNSLVFAPRASGKTSLLQAWVIWQLGRNPNLRIKWVCQSDRKARDTLAAIKKHIEQNPALKLVFPDLRPAEGGTWSASQIFIERGAISKDPSLEVAGILSSLVGGRCDILIGDDVVDLRNSILQPLLRDQVKAKFFGELLPVVDAHGRTLVIGTPWTVADLYAQLREQPDWHFLETPVGTDDDPFAPICSRYPRQVLQSLYRLWGPVEYDRAMRLRALTRETVPVRPAWIRYYEAADMLHPDELLCVIAVDPAISQTASADFFAVVVLLYDAKRNLIFVVDAWHDRLTFHDQAQAILKTYLAWQADRVVQEAANYEGALAQEVERLARERGVVLPIQTVKPKVKKERRLLENQPLLQNGRILFHPKLKPEGDPDVLQRGNLVGELLAFPVGKNDDLVDAFNHGLQFLREMGASSGETGEEPIESEVRVRVA